MFRKDKEIKELARQFRELVEKELARCEQGTKEYKMYEKELKSLEKWLR